MAGKLINCNRVSQSYHGLGVKKEVVFLLRHSTHPNGKVGAMRKKIADFYQRNVLFCDVLCKWDCTKEHHRYWRE